MVFARPTVKQISMICSREKCSVSAEYVASSIGSSRVERWA